MRTALAWARRHLSSAGRRLPAALRFVIFLVWNGLLELASPVVAVGLAPLFYWRLLTTNTVDAATLPAGDLTELNYPYRRWVAEQLARGESPWWNPYVSAGHSAIGDIQFRVLYPVDTWLATTAGGSFPLRLLELEVVAHVALGALFMYLLGRRLSGSRVGGLVAGVTFAFGGYLAGFPVQQMNLLEASVWLPLILLLVDVGAGLNVVAAFAVAAGALALAVLAGHPQTAFYIGVATLLYVAYKGWNGARIRVAALVGLPVLFLGALALAAVALLPAYFQLALTSRIDAGYAFASSGFSLREALGLVFPVEFGGAALYNGVFSLLLVAVALAASDRRREKLFWVGLGVLGLLFSFGGNTFLGSVQYLALGSLKFRDYERSTFLVAVAVAVLAGFGAAELTRPRRLRLGWLRRALRWPIALVAGLSVLLVVGFATAAGNVQGNLVSLVDRGAFTAMVVFLGAGILLARERGVLRAWPAGLLAVFLVGFDLFTTNWQNNLSPGDPDSLLQASPIAEYLESYTTGVFRIASEGLLPGDGNAGMLFRIEDLVGNSPLETNDYAEFDRQVPELTRWQILNVRYIVTQRKLDDPRFRLLRQDDKKNLYELAAKARLPRAFMVTQVVPAPDHAEALDLLKDVNLGTTAVVEAAATLPPAFDRRDDPAVYDQSLPTPTTAVTSTVRIVDDRANDLSIEASTPDPGLLVVGDVDYPGWLATVDGVPSQIYRTDGIIRSVFVPAGSHVIRFTFDPPGRTFGDSISQEAPSILLGLVVAEIVLRTFWFVVSTGYRFVRSRWRPPAPVA